MGLPFAHAPVFESQGELRLTTGLHQVTEEMTIAGITEEDIVGVTRL